MSAPFSVVRVRTLASGTGLTLAGVLTATFFAADFFAATNFLIVALFWVFIDGVEPGSARVHG